MGSDELYREIILDNYKNPSNRRNMPGANARAIDANPLCGDQIQILLKMQDGIVKDASFQGEGCAISIAVSSMLTEWAKGKSQKEILHFEKHGITEMLGGADLGPSRIKCALLPLKVLKMAIVSFESGKTKNRMPKIKTIRKKRE